MYSMQVIDELNKTTEGVLDFFYPRRCPVCDKTVKIGSLIHAECDRKIKYISGNTCLKCGKELLYDSDREFCNDCLRIKHRFDRNFSVFRYREISGSIYRFKYEGRREYADYYARATAKRLGTSLEKLNIDAVIPVPMYKEKQKMRGYNQAEAYAKSLSRELGIPYRRDVIARVRQTMPMKELNSSARRNNLKKAFNIVRNDVKFRCILIVDDIYTTGSTIDEIAHEFRMAKVPEIYSLTLAIGQTT